jgi:Do/DeqQ family serine protease
MQTIRNLMFGLVVAIVSAPGWAALPLVDGEGRQLPSLAPMLERVTPAVVNISTRATRTVHNPLLNDPFFRRFFNVPPGAQIPQQRQTQSAGSGVIIDAGKGTVVTNHHVIDGADEIMVSLHDGRSFKAELVGSDPEVDIAVLRIEADNLTASRLGDSDRTRVGDFVVAIGNPFGLGQTVTTGVVSAIGRTGLGIEGYEDFIQTDASINPGNSGGALVDLKGELVGINTAIIAPSGGNVGIGFAIPVNMARNSIEQILEHGEVRRGQLGVVIQDLTPALAEAFGLERNAQGVVVAEVQPGSAADKGGIEAGDVLVSIDGKPLRSAAQLRNEIGGRRIGETVRLTILRNEKSRNVSVKIGKPEASEATRARIHPLLEGATLRDSDDGRGVVVGDIARGSPAASSGLRPGDVIISANRKSVSNVAELRRHVSGSKQLLLRIVRGNAALFLVIQ